MPYVRHIQTPDGNIYDIQSGHGVKNESGTAMSQRESLKFSGLNVTDNEAGNETVVSAKAMKGATASNPGIAGYVPAPSAGDEGKFLRGDGSWAEAGGGGTTIVQKPTVTVGTYTYNGTAQGPTITWATGMEDNCVVTNATKTDAGTYTLTIALKNTATMVWADMTTADMTYEYSIAKANQTLTLSANSVTLDPDHLTVGVTVTGAETTLSATSSDSTVATASISGSTVTVSNVNENNGSATITLTAEATNNYNSATATISVTAAFTTFLDEWLTAADLNPALYADLNAVFADEKAIRKLFTIHDAVDYLVTNASDSNIPTIINNDYCAKWINLRDYALDTLYANATIAALMDTADKYFYGEWVITDSTTTPPTWGAKGNVPIMTSNTAPYGEANSDSYHPANTGETYEAYKAFDGNDATFHHSATGTNTPKWIYYKFTNPVCVKYVKILLQLNNPNSGIKSGTIDASNDGKSWTTLKTISDTGNYLTEALTYNINNENYYLYYRLYVTSSYYNVGNVIIVNTLQFYGRTLKVSVPTMTSNTAPYGEAFADGSEMTNTTEFAPFWAFSDVIDSNTSFGYYCWHGGKNKSPWKLGYHFTNPVKLKAFSLRNRNRTDTEAICAPLTFKIQASNDGSTWEDITEVITSKDTSTNALSYYDAESDDYYLYYRLYIITSTRSGNEYAVVNKLQFYGLDYSEYDWDADNPRHYIYDHGVELEELEQMNTTNGWSGYTFDSSSEKRPSEIYIPTTSGGHTSGFGLKQNIDITDYNLCFVISDSLSTSTSEGVQAGFSTQKNNFDRDNIRLAYVECHVGNNSNKYSIDISNINQNMYSYAISVNGTERTGYVYEMWLE